jgi:hypothetical protein
MCRTERRSCSATSGLRWPPTPRRSATMWRMSRAAACSVIWVQGQHVSSACEVRRVVAGLMWPQEDITDRLAADPKVAAGVAGAARAGDPCGRRPGSGRAIRHRRAPLPGGPRRLRRRVGARARGSGNGAGPRPPGPGSCPDGLTRQPALARDAAGWAARHVIRWLCPDRWTGLRLWPGPCTFAPSAATVLATRPAGTALRN